MIIAHLAGVSTDMTVLGAKLFLFGRLAYAGIYIAGISAMGVRTLAFFVALVGTLMIAYELLTAVPVAAA